MKNYLETFYSGYHPMEKEHKKMYFGDLIENPGCRQDAVKCIECSEWQEWMEVACPCMLGLIDVMMINDRTYSNLISVATMSDNVKRL